MENYRGVYFGHNDEINYFEGGAHFRYIDLYVALENLLKYLPKHRHGYSEDSSASVKKPKNQSRNIKPLIQSLTQKLTEITKEKNELSKNVITSVEDIGKINNTEEMRNARSVSKHNKILFQESNTDKLIPKGIFLEKLYKSKSKEKNSSNNNSVGGSTIPLMKKSLNLSHNKNTRNKTIIRELFRVGNNTKNDSFSLSKTLNKNDNRISSAITSVGNPPTNYVNMKRNFMSIPHQKITHMITTNNGNSFNISNNSSSVVENNFLKSNLSNKNKSKILNYTKPNKNLSHIGKNFSPKERIRSVHKNGKRIKPTILHYSNTTIGQNKFNTSQNNEIDLLSDLNTSQTNENKISNQINSGNNNIILKPKINISFVNNINPRAISKEKKSRNRQGINTNLLIGNNSLLKLNTTIKQKLFNELYLTNQDIVYKNDNKKIKTVKNKSLSKEKKSNPNRISFSKIEGLATMTKAMHLKKPSNNQRPSSIPKFNISEHYSSLQRKINSIKQKTKNDLAKLSADFENIITNKINQKKKVKKV